VIETLSPELKHDLICIGKLWIIVISITCLAYATSWRYEEDTTYIFTHPLIDAGQRTGANGLAWQENGMSFVMIDDTLPFLAKLSVLKHENCHVQQFRRTDIRGEALEPECEWRMWLP
jgi:hypothetical protein